MTEFDFYDYYEEYDRLIIYNEETYDFFKKRFNIIIDSIDFDNNQNVVLYIEDSKELKYQENCAKIEKKLVKTIKHLNDVEIKNTKIILTFDSKEIELH